MQDQCVSRTTRCIKLIHWLIQKNTKEQQKNSEQQLFTSSWTVHVVVQTQSFPMDQVSLFNSVLFMSCQVMNNQLWTNHLLMFIWHQIRRFWLFTWRQLMNNWCSEHAASTVLLSFKRQCSWHVNQLQHCAAKWELNQCITAFWRMYYECITENWNFCMHAKSWCNVRAGQLMCRMDWERLDVNTLTLAGCKEGCMYVREATQNAFFGIPCINLIH